MKPEEISSLNLAFLGDAVYSLMVRQYLVNSGDFPVGELTERSIGYVSAFAQAKAVRKLLDQDILNEQEKAVYMRGRNAHTNSPARHTDIQTYHAATGFEALIGYLYLKKDEERLRQIWDFLAKNRED